jgi:adenylate cyclase
VTKAAEGLGIDPQRLYEQLEQAILGQPRALNRVQVAEQAGVPLERAVDLWKALGFPGTDSDDAVLFTEADIEALKRVDHLVESGFIDPAVELTLVRSMGRSFARLAEWEISELASAAMSGSMMTDQARLEALIANLVPMIEDIQNYVWRRHIANAAGRMLLTPGGEDGVQLAVGFADIVGFTRRSRGLSTEELSHLVEVFEGTAASLVTEHRGRIIKTIGDEVLFVTDTATDAADLALALVEAHQEDPDFPEVRVGLAYGDVMTRLGDVFGPVVNIASRLTSLAKPCRVLVDRGMYRELKPLEDQFRLRRGRTATVKGYSRLDTYALKRPRSAGRLDAILETLDAPVLPR